ncbi:histone deacetylase family protein [Oculatella sp. LEGE 06141]|uniref:histone deacetylase family protein n=1 Tax=Oculatella sp. LEGE 06141 TaxID=1828648 RepID=UPI001881BF3D|nr:histone deacetylase family protein [Oculatella sp. LEGE 06141]MBE9178042.1 histone deacetylase family protein [Oculatella sp. LEGE 06141]
MITVYSHDHRYQNATVELIDGKLMPPVENPKRAEMLLSRVHETGLGDVIAPHDFGLEPVLRIHDSGFVSFLQTAWDTWIIEHGDYDALPLNWATRTMRHDRIPETIDGKLSYYSFDAGTPITAGTWKAAISSANVALTGQSLLQRGERVAFSLCRPPGHHAAADFYGGYCFLNNAAIAAQALRDAGAARVAILDVDYHHGNGTQAIFYDRADILFTSIHANPKQEYPYFLGYDDETGAGEGEGYNRNYPMPWGIQWDDYYPVLTDALQFIGDYAPDALVISLGVDTFETDPISKFRLVSEDFLRMGEAIARVAKPTLFVMEGGYAVEALGINAVNVLLGFENA